MPQQWLDHAAHVPQCECVDLRQNSAVTMGHEEAPNIDAGQCQQPTLHVRFTNLDMFEFIHELRLCRFVLCKHVSRKGLWVWCSMLTPTCSTPPCTNAAVSSRQYSPSATLKPTCRQPAGEARKHENIMCAPHHSQQQVIVMLLGCSTVS